MLPYNFLWGFMYKEDLKKYIPTCEQEEKDLKVMLDFIDEYGDFSLDRNNLIAHFSSSAWVVNKKMDKVLLNYHNIYKNWGWLGGHTDKDPNLLKVALKEVKEESGLTNIYPYSDDIISVEILPVAPHIKNGKFVNAHLHLNATYLIIADEFEKLTIKPDENSGLQWVNIDDVKNIVKEELMLPIYAKLNKYVKSLKKSI